MIYNSRSSSKSPLLSELGRPPEPHKPLVLLKTFRIGSSSTEPGRSPTDNVPDYILDLFSIKCVWNVVDLKNVSWYVPRAQGLPYCATNPLSQLFGKLPFSHLDEKQDLLVRICCVSLANRYIILDSWELVKHTVQLGSTETDA